MENEKINIIQNNRKISTHQLVFCAIFTALIALGAFIKVPIPVLPFTLQFLFTTMAGLILGGRIGAYSVLMYILLGLMGLPIFSEGGGIGYIFKPSFGYLIGFYIASYVTGKMFAFDHADVSPDIMCVSKGLTGGYMPMAITITTDEIYNAFYDDYYKGKAFMRSHTYSGNSLGCSAALAVQKILKEEAILVKAKLRADYLNSKLKDALLEHRNIGEIRSSGLINAMELVKDKKTKEGYDPQLRIGYEVYKRA